MQCIVFLAELNNWALTVLANLAIKIVRIQADVLQSKNQELCVS